MKRVFGGLTWPIDGSPAFFCLISEKQQDKTKTLEVPLEILEVSNELESVTLPELFKKIKDIKGIQGIYAKNDARYHSYIGDYSRWRRENSISYALRTPQNSSFEAGILKVKDLLAESLLKFQDDSLIRRQLKTLSKLSLKNERDYYAVSALCNVVGAFRKMVPTGDVKIPKRGGWY